ncbi:MAG: hypothetical protein ACE147_00370 [Candidatus Methylomirabilales bacterium]
MSRISAEVVEAVWEEVNGLSPERGREEIDRVAQSQPHLLPFVLAMLHDCRPQAQELGVYLSYLVLKIFEHGSRTRLPRVPGAQLERQLESNEEAMGRLEAASADVLRQAAAAQPSRQPEILKLVVEALGEPPGDSGGAALTEAEKAATFLTLKTVVDVLDDARGRLERA